MTTTIADNERAARMVPEDIATEGNVDLIAEIYTEDAVEHGPFGLEVRGIDAMMEVMERYLTVFPDFSATVEDVVSEGDTVAMRVTLRGTHEGEFRGIEPTNKSFEVQNMVFTRIEDGKIAERWVQPDTLGILQQLGIASVPGGMAAEA